MLLLSDFSVICIKFRVTGIIDLTPTVYSLFNLDYIITECTLLDVFKQNYYTEQSLIGSVNLRRSGKISTRNTKECATSK